MKKLFYLFLLLISISSVTVKAQTKHALIIAIGKYPKAGGWPQISSIRDAFYIRHTLLKQGFPEKNIKTVQDAAATITNINNALTELINEVSPGDIAVIHFSTHGEQVEDDNGDETDGLDETVVTYNAIAPSDANKKNYKINQSQYLRDDQFGAQMDQLRNKLGKNGDVIVFMDLCHSGSGSRGLAKVRGGKPPLISESFNDYHRVTGDTAGVFREASASRGDKTALATFVVISAARAEELDYETTDDYKEAMGSLSFAICKVFENLNEGTTYRSLFAKIQSVMGQKTPGQHPVMEGNGIDRMLFGGNIIQQKPYIEIEKISGGLVTVRAGLFAGLDSGAKVALYPAGTITPESSKLLTKGTVIKAGNYMAVVKPDKDPGFTLPVSGWVFIAESVYKTSPVVINIPEKTRGATTGFSNAEITNMKDLLKDFPLIKFDGDPELFVVKGETTDSLKVASNGYLFTTIKNTASESEQLKKEIQRYAQYKFLLGLEIKDPAANIEIKLVPVINEIPDIANIDAKTVNGSYEFNNGDKFVVWIKNNSKTPLYFNVLDVQPDGVINPMFPSKQNYIYPADLKIKENSSYLFSKYIIKIQPPYGMETLKVFASEKQIDVEGIATSAGRGEETRGNFGVLEKLVKTSYNLGTRGGTTENISNKEGSIQNVLFRITPGK